MNRGPHTSGVTLIEMLVVVAILAILAVIAKLGVDRLISQNRERALHGMFEILDAALQDYFDLTGKFPVFEDQVWVPVGLVYERLDAHPTIRDRLRNLPRHWGEEGTAKAEEAMLKSGTETEDTSALPTTLDPWDEPIQYQFRSGEDAFPRLRSYGPDRKDGTRDDIYNR